MRIVLFSLLALVSEWGLYEIVDTPWEGLPVDLAIGIAFFGYIYYLCTRPVSEIPLGYARTTYFFWFF